MRSNRIYENGILGGRVCVATHGDAAVLLCAAALLAWFILAPRLGDDRVPDLRPLETQQRKDDFLAFLDPIIAVVNRDVRKQRASVSAAAMRLESGQGLSWLDRYRLRRLARRYEIETEDADLVADVLPVLQRRVDTVPKSLVLVQAAKESGWGTSRFAIDGNNLFGQRCYEAGCGIAPKEARGAGFGLARFDSAKASVESYVRNINTHPEYAQLRRLRESMRRTGTAVTGLALADALGGYSERGGAYVDEIKSLIEQNGLQSRD